MVMRQFATAVWLSFSVVIAANAQTPGQGISPLNLSDSMDRLVREVMDQLDAVNQVHTVVGWTNDGGSRAIEDVGIALSRSEIVGLAGTASGERFRDVLTFTLAHEQTHMIQFSYYSSGTHDLRNSKALEEQADILGGLSFTAVLLNNRRSADSAREAMTEAFRLPEKLASGATHPTPDQRQRAVSLGILAELQLVDWRTYRISQDPAMLSRLQDAKRRFPDLPDEGENLMVWSNRAAKSIVGQTASQ